LVASGLQVSQTLSALQPGDPWLFEGPDPRGILLASAAPRHAIGEEETGSLVLTRLQLIEKDRRQATMIPTLDARALRLQLEHGRLAQLYARGIRSFPE
jgi:hypothetical protein